jgi:osmotically-inducible protein OsmY
MNGVPAQRGLAGSVGNPRTRSANIRVTADVADVLTTGSADKAKALDAITEVAGAVPGVARVENEVGVGGHWQW